MSAPQQQPAEAYAQLDQGQRASIAQAFIDRLKGQSDPKSQELAQVNPATATPQQVAQMHEHAAQSHPGILGDIMKHPASPRRWPASPPTKLISTSAASTSPYARVPLPMRTGAARRVTVSGSPDAASGRHCPPRDASR
jgi:hypothetical protein